MLPAIPTVEEAKLIAEQASTFFADGTVDSVELIGTRFISLLRSRVDKITYLPATPPNISSELMVEQSEAEVAAAKSNSDQSVNPKRLIPVRLFEPSVLEVMSQQLIPKYLENVIYQALLDASSSELAARMNAMTNASNNARDLISSLTLIYNKARQSGITQDLLEIVGGAEALKG